MTTADEQQAALELRCAPPPAPLGGSRNAGKARSCLPPDDLAAIDSGVREGRGADAVAWEVVVAMIAGHRKPTAPFDSGPGDTRLACELASKRAKELLDAGKM